MLQKVILVLQLILSGLMVIAILLQQRGAGLGAGFGGSSTIHTTRRGVDKSLFQITIALSILFFAVALANILI